ncbi:hypothetical protein NSB04_23170 [Blautia pseudococcoides]|nr:hypothetical protein [Blautia pseudococcoides]
MTEPGPPVADRVVKGIKGKQRSEKMDGKILIVGAAILDVLAGPADEGVFQTGSSPAEAITMRTGGDALNEASFWQSWERRSGFLLCLVRTRLRRLSEAIAGNGG